MSDSIVVSRTILSQLSARVARCYRAAGQVALGRPRGDPDVAELLGELDAMARELVQLTGRLMASARDDTPPRDAGGGPQWPG